jgi:hypothetical protein
MTDEQKEAQARYNAATKRLQNCTPNDRLAEQQFGLAYKAMVDAGLVSMPIKRKYRGA